MPMLRAIWITDREGVLRAVSGTAGGGFSLSRDSSLGSALRLAGFAASDWLALASLFQTVLRGLEDWLDPRRSCWARLARQRRTFSSRIFFFCC
eukprot:scaffold2129_cov255-Pinguiococcus_pyrenoidosus.AAC.15